MKFVYVASFLALCVFAQSVHATIFDVKEDECEDWLGIGGTPRRPVFCLGDVFCVGCDDDCIFPHKKCCVVHGPLCIPDCPLFPGYCVEDPEFCIKKLEKKCKDVPKHVCVDKPICKKVKKEVCKTVDEEKCDFVDVEVCEPVEKCDTKPHCTVKQVCDGGSSRASSISSASSGGGGGGSSSIASSSAFAGDNSAQAQGSAFGDVTFSSTQAQANSGGCRPVEVCDDKRDCTTETVCKIIKKKVCKKHPVEKCFFVWEDVCTTDKVCSVVKKEVCELVEVEICKDPIKCHDKFCDPWYKCNPDCCPESKIPVCIDLKKPFIAVKPAVHG